MAHERSNEHPDEHQHTYGDVDAVQSRDAVEDAPVDTRGDVEAFGDDQVGVLVGLARQEAQAEQDGDDQPALERVSVVAADRVLRSVRGEAAGDQHHGQDDGQRERGDAFEA